jgi:drug/metabolite transporter (DMT)-like permease
MSRQHVPHIGISLTISAYFFLSLFSALNKAVQEAGFPWSQVMLFDGIVGALCMVFISWTQKDLKGLRWKNWQWQAPLMIINTAGAYLTFQAYPYLPLVNAYLIAFCGPLIIATLSAIFLKERMRWRQAAAIIVSFIGVVIAMGPQDVVVHEDMLSAIIKMFAGISMFAVAQVMVRKLSDTESTWSFPFYYYVGMAVVSVILFHTEYKMPVAPRDWGMLLGLGVLDAAALAMIYMGLRYSKASVNAPFQYSCLLWVVLLDMVLWDKFPQAHTWVGAAIVVTAGIYLATLARKRPKKRQ